MNAVKHIVKFNKKYMLPIVFILMAIAVAVGMRFHASFLALKWTLPIALYLMLYHPMIYMDLRQAFTKKTREKTRYLLIATIAYTIIFPLLTWLLVTGWASGLPWRDPKILAGITLIGLAPLPSSAPAFTSLAGGKSQLVLIGVIYTFFLSIVIVPVYAAIILSTIIPVPIMMLVKSLIIYIIIPLIIGQTTKYIVLKYYGKEGLEKLKPYTMLLSIIGMYWMVIEVFGINAIMIVMNPLLIAVGAILMNVYFLARMGLMYYAGKLLRLGLPYRIALLYSAGTNMTIGTALAIGSFGSRAAIGTALGGPFSDMILMMIFVQVFNRMKE
jgi:ACR3 family arsenite transporter